MNANWYLIATGKLQVQSAPIDWAMPIQDTRAEYWVDIDGCEPGELREFLAPLDLHPLLLDRCIDQAFLQRKVHESGDRSTMLCVLAYFFIGSPGDIKCLDGPRLRG